MYHLNLTLGQAYIEHFSKTLGENIMYTIGQVSELFGLPISTLRYYDKEGLFPGLERTSGIRKFGEKELEALRIIECLKKSGLEIKDIKRFMKWCAEGSATYPQRRELLLKQKEHVEAEIQRMNQVLDMLTFKCWYYEQAIQDGNEDRLNAMKPEDMPTEIRQAYENAHQ
ncbi:MAG: MerR family transcriptional regulator [Butyricicoccus sp.]